MVWEDTDDTGEKIIPPKIQEYEYYQEFAYYYYYIRRQHIYPKDLSYFASFLLKLKYNILHRNLHTMLLIILQNFADQSNDASTNSHCVAFLAYEKELMLSVLRFPWPWQLALKSRYQHWL